MGSAIASGYTIEDAPSGYSVEDAPPVVKTPLPKSSGFHPLDSFAAWVAKKSPQYSPQEFQDKFGQYDAAKQHPYLSRGAVNLATGTVSDLGAMPAAIADWFKGPLTPRQSAQRMQERAQGGVPFDPKKPITKDDVTDYISEKGSGIAAGAIAGEVGAGLIHGVTSPKGAATNALRRLTKTTGEDIGEFVAKTAKENADAVRVAADKTRVNKERVDDLNARRNEVYQTRKAAVEEKNRAMAEQFSAKQAEQREKLAADRTTWAEKEHSVRQAERAAQEVEAKKEVITRAQGEYARLALDNLKKAKESANTALNARWNSLRAKMERPSITDKGIDMRPVKAGPIVDAIDDARTKYLVGSPEDLKAFNDLMGRIETGPAQDTAAGVKPMAQNLGWSEARIHFSNIADKMYSGNLPGNVWKALREVHDALDEQLRGAAKERGLEGEYTSLKNDWSHYKDDFDDLSSVRTAGGSPLAQVVRAQIPADLESVLKGKYGDLLLERAAKYRNRGANPDILNRYRQLGKKAEALESPRVPQRTSPLKDGQVSSVAPQVKPLPKEPTPLTAKPVTPDVSVVRPQDVQQFKADRVLDKADRVRSSSGHIATFIAVLDGLRGIFSGNPGEVALDVAGRAGYAAGKEQFARMLEHRSVVNALSNLTPEDVSQVMRLPPEQRTGFTNLAKQAQAKGIKIPPAAAAALGIGLSIGTYPQVSEKLQGASQ